MELYQLFYYPSLAIFVVLLYKWLSNKERRFQLDHQIQKRRNEREAQFEKIEKYSSSVTKQRADEIAKWSFTELRENLRSGSVSCEDVLKAYQQKAIRADQKTNCVCLFIEESMKIAQSLDEKAKSSTYVKPALFGVPVSIKECIKIKGMDSTLGYAQDLFKPSEDNAIIVKQLINFGAVPFVHTNVPLSLCSYGCTNAVYGATGNPLDISRVPGGSSGGEAALIADSGSILGIGTDVGGSIRSPANFCGISGFKPSCRRFSHLGCAGGVPGRQLIVANEGPMAKDIDTCIEYLKLAWGDNFLSSVDPYVPPVLWQQKQFSSTEKLTIGYYTNDDFIQAAPGNERVVLDCVKILRSLGHKMVPFSVPDGQRAFELLAATVAADGGKFLNDRMDKDLVLPESDFNFVSRRLPLRVQRLIGKVLPWKRIGGILQALPINCEEQRMIFAEVEAYRHTFVKQMMDNDIDVIICPSMALYPPEHDVPSKLLPATNYTSLYNLLDFAAGTVPMTKVTKEDDIALDQYPENDPFDRKIKQQCKGMVGFPIGIQVAAPPYREEMALRILKQLSSHTSI